MCPNKQLKNLCYFCGLEGADTIEDIPPRSFFPDGQRQGLIRIPAHASCNGNWTKAIEYFRNVFSGLSGKNNFTASVLFDTKGKRSLQNSPKLRSKLVSELRPRIDFISAGGVYLGSKPGVYIDPDHKENFVNHMVRGLYFHHKKVPLPANVKIKTHLQPRTSAPLIIQSMPIVEIHPKVFKYRYLFANDHIHASAWLLGFYDVEAGTIFAITDPSGESQLGT